MAGGYSDGGVRGPPPRRLGLCEGPASATGVEREGRRKVPVQVMEVPHVEPAVGLAIQTQDPLYLADGRLAGRGQLPPIVKPELLIASSREPSAAPHLPGWMPRISRPATMLGPYSTRASFTCWRFIVPLHTGCDKKERRHSFVPRQRATMLLSGTHPGYPQ